MSALDPTSDDIMHQWHEDRMSLALQCMDVAEMIHCLDPELDTVTQDDLNDWSDLLHCAYLEIKRKVY